MNTSEYIEYMKAEGALKQAKQEMATQFLAAIISNYTPGAMGLHRTENNTELAIKYADELLNQLYPPVKP